MLPGCASETLYTTDKTMNPHVHLAVANDFSRLGASFGPSAGCPASELGMTRDLRAERRGRGWLRSAASCKHGRVSEDGSV